MPTLWYPNFDVEYQWREQHEYCLPRNIRQLQQDMACVFLLLAQDGDLIATDSPWEECWLEELTRYGLPKVKRIALQDVLSVKGYDFEPWGWSHAMLKLAGLGGDSEAEHQVLMKMTANSKVANCDYEQGNSLGFCESAVIRNQPQLADQCLKFPVVTKWLLKSEFAAASRDRWQITTSTGKILDCIPNNDPFEHPTAGFVLEPFIEKAVELSFHWTVRGPQNVNLDGVTWLITENGRYLGNVAMSESDQQQIIDSFQDVLAHQKQYVVKLSANDLQGPVSIDAMVYNRQGHSLRRALQDVNARYSMGRVTLQAGRKWASEQTSVISMFKAFPTAQQLSQAEQDADVILVAPRRSDGQRPLFAATFRIDCKAFDQTTDCV